MNISDRNRLVESLLIEHGKALTQYFFRRTANMAEAEDMTNEIFFRLIRKMNQEPVENPRAFLFSAAANLLNDQYRRSSIRRDYVEQSNCDKDSGIEVLSPERALGGKQALQSVMQLLGKLNVRTREVFLRHRVEGMKHAEIARLYGISVSSVEKDIMKCLVQIAKHGPDEVE